MLHTKPLLLLGAFCAILLSLFAMSFNPGGASIMDATAGFAAPFDQVFHLMLYGAMGVWAVMLGRRAAIIMPMAMLLMFVMGVCLQIPSAQYGAIPFIVLFTLGLYIFTLTLVRKGIVGISIVLCSATAFHHGLGFADVIATTGSPLFFMLGSVVALTLVMAIILCVGILTLSSSAPLYERMQRSPSFGSFL